MATTASTAGWSVAEGVVAAVNFVSDSATFAVFLDVVVAVVFGVLVVLTDAVVLVFVFTAAAVITFGAFGVGVIVHCHVPFASAQA